jgi:hypothetical protein
MARYRGAIFVVEMAMTLAMIVTRKGQMMCRVRSCFLSECHPLIVIAATHRRYGGAVIARVVVRLKLRPATTIGKKFVTEAAI